MRIQVMLKSYEDTRNITNKYHLRYYLHFIIHLIQNLQRNFFCQLALTTPHQLFSSSSSSSFSMISHCSCSPLPSLSWQTPSSLVMTFHLILLIAVAFLINTVSFGGFQLCSIFPYTVFESDWNSPKKYDYGTSESTFTQSSSLQGVHTCIFLH